MHKLIFLSLIMLSVTAECSSMVLLNSTFNSHAVNHVAWKQEIFFKNSDLEKGRKI